MTDATFEQQGESKRRREHPEVPQAADSSSSTSSECSTDTEMGLVDVRTILRDNSEAESRCAGGPITLDLTKWDFHRADCRDKCRNLVENSKPLLLIGSPVGSGRENKERARGSLHGVHLRGVRNTTTRWSVFPLGTVNSCGFHEQVSRHVPDGD